MGGCYAAIHKELRNLSTVKIVLLIPINICFNLFPFSTFIRILGSKVAIYLEKVLPHDPVTLLPDLTITDKEHNYLKINEMPFRC